MKHIFFLIKIGGLVFLEYYVVLIDALLGPTLWLVNPWYLEKRYKQYKVYKQVEKTGNKIAMT